MPLDLSNLPALNAALNGTAAILLAAGYLCVRTGRRRAHGWLMGCAFGVSTVFLVSYLYYHYHAGHTTFPDLGWIRTAYLILLASHVILAALVAPLAVAAVYQAARRRFDRHVRITRILFPIWIYVSVTGVIIYLMLYHWFR